MPTFKPRNTERARTLRREATPVERALWRYLAGGALGAKFSRQMPVGPYFADFLCRELMIVVELDGPSHEARQEQDAARDRFMAQAGYRVLRFTNGDVRENMEGVVQVIQMAVTAARGQLFGCRRMPTPNPSRKR